MFFPIFYSRIRSIKYEEEFFMVRIYSDEKKKNIQRNITKAGRVKASLREKKIFQQHFKGEQIMKIDQHME